MALDPENLTGKKLSGYSEAIDLTGIFLAAFKKNVDNYYVDASVFALANKTYTKQEVQNLLQALSNSLNTAIKAVKQTYKKIYEVGSQSNTIQDDYLKGAELLLVVIDNMVNEETTLNSTTGTLDFTAIGGVYPGNKITVLINKTG